MQCKVIALHSTGRSTHKHSHSEFFMGNIEKIVNKILISLNEVCPQCSPMSPALLLLRLMLLISFENHFILAFTNYTLRSYKLSHFILVGDFHTFAHRYICGFACRLAVCVCVSNELPFWIIVFLISSVMRHLTDK